MKPVANKTRRTLTLAVLAGVAGGAIAGYAVTAGVYNERAAASAQASDLRAKAADERIAELQNQLHDAQADAARRQETLMQEADAQQSRAVRQVAEQERAVSQQQQALIEQGKQRERDLAKPDLPLRLWAHKPTSGRGIVVSIHNFGAKEVPLTLTLHRAKVSNPETVTITVAPNANQLLGSEPGFLFSPGDDISLYSDDYRPGGFQVPQRKPPQTPAEVASGSAPH
jgi:hypothetical protein